ncbi:MAG: hypothetical protein ACKVS6_17290 [Planctomycetota bacterium]
MDLQLGGTGSMKRAVAKKTSAQKSGEAIKSHPWTHGGLANWESGAPQRPDDMSPEVLEFIKALDDYKTLYNRKFPGWSEVLGVLLSLGYRKVQKN